MYQKWCSTYIWLKWAFFFVDISVFYYPGWSAVQRAPLQRALHSADCLNGWPKPSDYVIKWRRAAPPFFHTFPDIKFLSFRKNWTWSVRKCSSYIYIMVTSLQANFIINACPKIRYQIELQNVNAKIRIMASSTKLLYVILNVLDFFPHTISKLFLEKVDKIQNL